MNLADLVARIWRHKWRSLLLALLSAALGVFFTYHFSVSPLSLQPRALRFGVAETNLLVDSGTSPLALPEASLDTSALAGTISESVDSNFVLQAVAHALMTRPQAIGIEQQYVQELPRVEVQAKQAQVGTQILATQHKYSILVRNDAQTFVIQLFTQAPTAAEAIKMANVASAALANHINGIAKSEHVRPRHRVIVRQLASATGNLVDPSAPRDAAILIGLLSWGLLMIASFTVDRARALRSQRLTPAQQAP